VEALGTPNSGRYLCVLGGSVVHDGTAYPTRSLGWVGSLDDPPEVASVDDGFDLLVVQLPPTSAIWRDGEPVMPERGG
jgi:hypothetical protein